MTTIVDRPVGARPVPTATIRAKVHGEARYTADLMPAGAAAIALVRSPHPHARIAGVDVAAALSADGVLGTLTGEDFGDYRMGHEVADQPVLAHRTVRYVGEAVVAVAATTAEQARAAAALVAVTYEVLPHAVTPEAALALAEPIHADRPDNVARQIAFERGDFERAAATAEHWVEGTFEVHAAHHGYMEPYAAFAGYDAGRAVVTIHAATHAPGPLQRDYRLWFDRWGVEVQMRTPTVGGAFGAKYEHPLHLICGEFARRLGRDVGIVLTRQEDFLIGNARQGVRIWARIGATVDGKLVAKESRVLADNGAYSMHGPSVLLATMMRMDNLWRLDAVRSEGRLVYTNTPGTQCQRGFGDPDSAFAQEQLLDELAGRLGLSPLELRRRNSLEGDETTLHGWHVSSCEHIQCLDAIDATIEADRNARAGAGAGDADGRYAVGYGVASGMHTVGNRIMHDRDHAEVRLVTGPDRLEIWAGEPDVGQGTVPSLARMAAETLGLDVASVDVVLGDTEHGPFGHGAFSSRTTFFTGNALLDGCLRLRERARELAGELGIEDGGPLAVAAELEARGLSLDPLVVSGHYVCEVTDVYGPTGEGNRSPTYGFAVHGCRVRVDRWTGAVTVERYWTMHDAGAVIWPAGAIGQVIGGVLHAAGQALSERVRRTPDGRMANPGFLDYRLPTSVDSFPVEPGFARSHDAQGPLGAKAIGELPLIPVAAALANAIHDATGARVLEAPMEPEAVLRAITEGHALR